MIALAIIIPVVLFLAGLTATLLLIPTMDQLPGRDWSPAPACRQMLPDRLDRLASQYTLPRPLLDELLRIDRLIASVDAVLLVDRTLGSVGL